MFVVVAGLVIIMIKSLILKAVEINEDSRYIKIDLIYIIT